MWWVALLAVLVVVLTNLIVFLFNANNPLYKCCKIKGCDTFFVSNRAPGTGRPESYLAWDVIERDHFYTGSFGRVGGIVLRGVEFAFFVAVVVAEMVVDAQNNREPDWLTFFTNWTFVVFGLYSLLGFGMSIWRYRQAKKSLAPLDAPVPSLAHVAARWAFGDRLLLLLFGCVLAASLALTAFYWAVLFDPNYDSVTFDNAGKHGGSALLLVVEVVVCRIPMASYQVMAPLLYGTVYIVFLWVWWGATSEWVYSALSWSEPTGVVYTLAMAVLVVVAWLLGYLFALVRELLFHRADRRVERAHVFELQGVKQGEASKLIAP